jgi:hypothetical protein
VRTSPPQPKNVGGDLLILDAGSMIFRGNHPVAPSYTTPDACARACALVPGCNAYNFCGRRDGCGSGCAAYAQRQPKLPSDPSQSGSIAPANKKLPITVRRLRCTLGPRPGAGQAWVTLVAAGGALGASRWQCKGCGLTSAGGEGAGPRARLHGCCCSPWHSAQAPA